MELWIRSQDRKYLIKVNKEICIMDYDDDFFKAIRVDDLQVGSYSTKERALEVLDEIQSILEQINDPNLTILPVFVYEMPEE